MELACLQASVGRLDETQIAACEATFDGDAMELQCLHDVVGVSPAAVAACERAFDGDAMELECVRAVRGTRYDPTQLVAYCEQTEDGDANELACLGRFR